MSIRWDTVLARHTARELDRSLAGARLRAVRLDREARDLTLIFKDRALIWRLHPTRGDLRLHPPVDPADGDHRIRCTLTRVVTPPDERLVRFDFSPAASGPVSIVVELMSAQWNAVVTEGEADIVRHILWRPSGDTRRTVGQPYQMPAPTGRTGIEGEVTLPEWLAALEPVAAPERPRALVRTFAWTSPLNAAALLGEPAGQDGESGLEAGFSRWKQMADPEAAARPVVLSPDSEPQPYPFPLPGTPSRPAASLLEAFEACGGGTAGASPAAVLGPDLRAELERQLRQVTRRVRKLESELAGLADPQALRAVGDLILARYRDIPAGSEAATLTGFDGQPVDVRLAPGEPAHESAGRYYRDAAKAERAAERLPRILAAAHKELAGLEELVGRVRAGTAEAQDVRAALGPAREARPGAAPGAALPYRTYRSSGGLEIRVGRGSRFNDDLTFHHSSPGDVWLHTRQSAGAHVILRWQGQGRPPARDLEEAAILAALHSKARTSGTVPVDWTLRKYVRKPRKSPPGQVLVEREETLFVEPDEALLEALAEQKGSF